MKECGYSAIQDRRRTNTRFGSNWAIVTTSWRNSWIAGMGRRIHTSSCAPMMGTSTSFDTGPPRTPGRLNHFGGPRTIVAHHAPVGRSLRALARNGTEMPDDDFPPRLLPAGGISTRELIPGRLLIGAHSTTCVSTRRQIALGTPLRS